MSNFIANVIGYVTGLVSTAYITELLIEILFKRKIIVLFTESNLFILTIEIFFCTYGVAFILYKMYQELLRKR